MKKIVVWGLCVICFLVLLTGCGSADAVLVNKLDPVKLLTKQEAQEALGKPVKDAEIKENPTGKICVYSSQDGDSFIQLALQDKDNAVQIFTDLKTNLKGIPAPGIGDNAFWAPPGLHVLKGKVYFSIASGKGGVQEINTKLAKIVLTRL